MQFLDALLQNLLELASHVPKSQELLQFNTVALLKSFSSFVSWCNDEILNVHVKTIKELTSTQCLIVVAKHTAR